MTSHFFLLSLPPMENTFQSGYNPNSLSLFSFTLSHPLGFPKSLSFWNKEQNYFQTISVFSHATPYNKATRPEAAGRERSPTERKRKKSTFQNIIWPNILFVVGLMSPRIHILSCLVPVEDVYPLTTSGCCPLSLGLL